MVTVLPAEWVSCHIFLWQYPGLGAISSIFVSAPIFSAILRKHMWMQINESDVESSLLYK